MAKLVIHLVKLFEKEKPELFKGKAQGVSDLKFKYLNLKCLDYMFLLLLGVTDYVVR